MSNLNEENIQRMAEDENLKNDTRSFFNQTCKYKYSYNFTWMGRPIIQFPQDIVAMQELIWQVQPDLLIETGIAHGGSIIFSASMLELISSCGGGDGEVLAIDIDIRDHNRKAIEEHPMYKRINMIEGSSIDPDVISKVTKKAHGKEKILVFLDSNHTHEHVLAELEAYAPLTSVGSYCVVFDTVVEDMSDDFFEDRPWGKGNNPKTAVWEWLKKNKNFEIDKKYEDKLLLTVAPDGFLKRTG